MKQLVGLWASAWAVANPTCSRKDFFNTEDGDLLNGHLQKSNISSLQPYKTKVRLKLLVESKVQWTPFFFTK